MAKPTARNLNQLLKVMLITSALTCVQSVAFPQLEKESPVLAKFPGVTDTLPSILKSSAISFQRTFLNSFKESKAGLLEELNKRSVIVSGMAGLLKNPIVFNSAIFSTEGIADSSYLGGELNYRTNSSFSSQWSIAGIPLDINTRQQSWSDFTTNEWIQYNFHFDREAYLSQLKKSLAGKIDPAVLMDRIRNPLQDIMNKAKQGLVNELRSINDRYKGMLESEITEVRMQQDLLTSDIRSLKARFLSPAFIKDITAMQQQLTSLQQQVNNGNTVDKEEIMRLENQVGKLKGLQEIVSMVEQHKTRWEESGLISKIKEFGILKQTGITNLLNDPSVITRLARQKLSLSGLQRFFLNISKLDIGQNALSNSPLSLQHFLSKGINTELLSNNRSLLLVAGKQTDFNSILDFPFTNSPFSTNGVVRSLGIGSGKGSRSTTNLSVSSFSQSMAGLTDALSPAMLRQVLVTTISNRMGLGEKGFVSVELSRSATQYNFGDERLRGEKNSLSRMFSTDNFMANTALSLKYADELTEHGLSYNFAFNKTSNGYTNPGNSYLSAGTTEWGTGFRKSLFKKKVLFSFRGNSRIYKYNDKIDAKWMNTQLLLDLRLKMKKGQYVALRYQPVVMSRKEDANKKQVSSMERIAVEGSVFRKIGRFSYRNYFTLSGQKSSYLLTPLTSLKTTSVTISSFQHLLLGKKMMYVNMNYTKADNSAGQLFLNTSFYAETGYSYQLHKNIIASSGLVYNSVAGWYRQAGIRQTVSGQLGEKFSINLYVDLKRDIEVFYPLWDDPVRADIGLRYLINNKN